MFRHFQKMRVKSGYIIQNRVHLVYHVIAFYTNQSAILKWRQMNDLRNTEENAPIYSDLWTDFMINRRIEFVVIIQSLVVQAE